MNRNRISIWLAMATVAGLAFSGCAPAKMDLVPLSPDDRALLDEPFPIFWTPILNKVVDQRPVITGAILFDGTWNDRLNVPKEERKTIEAHLHDKLQGLDMPIFHYYVGAGTQHDIIQPILDGADGYTTKPTAEQAATEVISEIVALRRQQPNSEIRLLVSGFSRGSAAARHFMNTLEQRWYTQGLEGEPPTFYALIFDTVATGQSGNLQLQVPLRADIFYHFVSNDERRISFSSIIDDPQNDPDGRIVTIIRPGVHSDIGTSYQNGIGSEYIAFTDALISSMGLISPSCFAVNGDARSQGKNDSRWLFERALGIGAPNTLNVPTYRNSTLIPISPLSESYRRQWKRRIVALQFENDISRPFCLDNHYLGMPRFVVERTNYGFEVSSLPPFSVFDPKIRSSGKEYILTFLADGITLSRIAIPPSILNKIDVGKRINLGIGIITKEDGAIDFWWFTNNVRNQQADVTLYKSQ